ncbi:MAG TPA: SurA N-terminal domain-containing protein [Gammaproteobacteria bacterium]|jgi:peptidyl-prolyl cis-trans isomerase D|nr:SurA N-terminal domain-containing protein [Gammaproteobacteria bacterium]
MLQRIHDSLGRWIAVIVLGLVSAGFIFWGVERGTTSSASFAAKVNGENISITDFDRELQNRQNEYQRVYRTELTEDLRRQLRRSVVDEMVRETALKQRVDAAGYRASNERVSSSIREIPAFQAGGEFSMDVYRGLLANQGLTPAAFEAMQRTNLAAQDLQSGIADSTFLTPAEFRRYIELYNQRREIAYALFDTAAFAPKATVDDAAISARYEGNQAAYQTPETVDLEYVELSLADIAAGIQLTEDDLHAAYEEEKDRFQAAEERHARHILIPVADGQEDAARKQADAVEARLKAGEDFAKVAKEVSTDAGTKEQGGDLGWIARGTLPGPFEDTLFGLKVGEVSAPVRSDFGFHVIRLEETRGGTIQPFEAVRDELASETKTRRAEMQFNDKANQLGDKAFDAYNELASVATAMQLPLKTVKGFPRTGDQNLFRNSAAVVQAAFSDDVVDSGRNSKLVELADDDVLVLRVTAHNVPKTKPLDEVRGQIRDELVHERSQEMAEMAAGAFLADIEKGGDPAALATMHGGTWHAAAWVQRTDSTVPTEVLSAAFAMRKPAASSVQREAVALANGNHAVLVLSGVQAGEPGSLTQSERDQRQKQLADQSARAELTAYIDSVRDEATVRIPPEVLEPPAY